MWRLSHSCWALLWCLIYLLPQEIGQSESHEFYKQEPNGYAHVPPGHIIFNTAGTLSRLCYYDSNHYYVSGLDPTYLCDRNPDLSQLYERITLGKEDDPGPLIRDRFGATYVFSDNEHHDFFDKAHASGWFEIAYEDEQCTIMRIRDEKLTYLDPKEGYPADEKPSDADQR